MIIIQREEMTRQELADILGISRSTLNQWEKNRPELVRLINLGLMADEIIETQKKTLEALKEIEEKASSGKFQIGKL